ncbi:MAG: U32 family peptidase [Oscillibacter sp.]|nr:U32 family peptidase [Oscillibacter sp.]
MDRPELLSPAGSPESLRAAVQHGADAVYLGWGEFNARRSAKNFSDEEFREALRYCHARGVRVFLTLNTLVTDRELPKALETAAEASRLGIDAVLVQDWGLFDLLRKALPDLPLHASTQMSVFTSGGACEAAADGCERVVIARECSREDTKTIIENCPAEIEIFVHGALCMCYSGQCEMSALIGGRSGNRGRCAQPCRLPYGVDGKAGKKYPLSLKDSCLAGELQDMADMGVSCLKLEGRMKRPEYVAVIARIYSTLLSENRTPTAAEEQELEDAFSRSGFTDWYWQGRRGSGMFGTRGENAPEPRELFAAARAAYEKESRQSVDVHMSCRAASGEPLTLTLWDEDGHSVTVTGSVPEAARSRAVTAEEMETRLGKTGGTPYRCASVHAEVEEGLSLPASAINALRREGLEALTDQRIAPPQRRRLEAPPLPEADCSAAEPEFTVSVMYARQITPELLALNPARIYAPVEVLASMPVLPETDARWCAILPRVWRDRDEKELLKLLSIVKEKGVTAVAAGNIGHFSIAKKAEMELFGDYGLNVFNSRSLAYLQSKDLRSACVSFELRFAQIRDLTKVIPTEAIVYGRLPLMITENCLVQNSIGCKLDQTGRCVSEKAPCAGGHCLVDRTGAAFPMLGVYGHRTELQNSRPLYLADRSDYRRCGLAYARLRFTTESPEECVEIFRAYRENRSCTGEFTRGLYERGVE